MIDIERGAAMQGFRTSIGMFLSFPLPLAARCISRQEIFAKFQIREVKSRGSSAITCHSIKSSVPLQTCSS